MKKNKKHPKVKVTNIKTVPGILKSRYNKIMIIAIITFIVGAIFVIIGFGSRLAMMLIFWLTALSATGYAIKYKHDLEFKGYRIIEGIVTYKKEIFTIPTNITKSSSTKRPYYYHIKDEEGKLYRLDVTKGNEDLPLRCHVRLYAPTNALETISNGITIISPIWVYEIIGEYEPVVIEKNDEKA